MKKSLVRTEGRLATYLTAGLGVGCLAGQAEAATVVTLYGPGAKSAVSSPATPLGFDIGSFLSAGNRYIVNSAQAVAGFGSGNTYFSSGADLAGLNNTNWGYGQYLKNDLFTNGATPNSSQNYANISFNGGDGVYEAVGQFYLDGTGGGYLVAMAKSSDNSALSISAGKAAIAAVPEPSALALLALGAGGLLARRRRSAA